MSRIRITSITKILLFFIFFLSIHADSKIFDPAKKILSERISAVLGGSKTLSCKSEGNHTKNYSWVRIINPTEIQKKTNNQDELEFKNITREDNGTYECRAENGYEIIKKIHLVVIALPRIESFVAKSVTTGKIYVEWKTNNVDKATIQYKIWFAEASKPEEKTRFPERIKSEMSGSILNSNILKKGVNYRLGIQANTEIGHFAERYSDLGTLLEKDFVPNPEIYNITEDSISIRWQKPQQDLENYYTYTISKIEKDVETKPPYSNIFANNFTIRALNLQTDYRFQVKFCVINHPELCGNWSTKVEGRSSSINIQTVSSRIYKNVASEISNGESIPNASTKNPLERNANFITILSLFFSIFFTNL